MLAAFIGGVFVGWAAIVALCAVVVGGATRRPGAPPSPEALDLTRARARRALASRRTGVRA